MTRRPEDLLGTLGRIPIPAESAELASGRRERVLQRLQLIEQQQAAKVRTRSRRIRMAGVSVAFACGVAAALGLPRLRSMIEPASHVPLRLIAGQIETAPQGLRSAEGSFFMSTGQALRAAGGDARVAMDRNTTIDLAANTELSFVGVTGGRIVELHRGFVRLVVEGLVAGQSLAVRTSDATITVHGTRFSVTAGDATQVCTTVVLERGVVSVDSRKRRVLLTAPAKWTSCLAPATAASHEPRREPLEQAALTRPAPSQARAPSASEEKKAPAKNTPEAASRAPASSTLADENALLASARQAALHADHATALSRLERLLRLYPRSILAQNASVERFRSLKRLGRDDDARNAATRYLSEYPDGFARDEARALVSTNP